jgi:hypothetical protein
MSIVKLARYVRALMLLGVIALVCTYACYQIPARISYRLCMLYQPLKRKVLRERTLKCAWGMIYLREGRHSVNAGRIPFIEVDW